MQSLNASKPTSTQAEKLWYCLFEKKLFPFHVLDLNVIFANQDPLPTFKTRKFLPTYENAWIRPCLSRSTQMYSLCRFTSCRRAE